MEGRAEAMAGTFSMQNVANTLWAYGRLELLCSHASAIPEALFVALTKRILECDFDVDEIPPLLRAVELNGRRLETGTLEFFVEALRTQTSTDPLAAYCAALSCCNAESDQQRDKWGVILAAYLNYSPALLDSASLRSFIGLLECLIWTSSRVAVTIREDIADGVFDSVRMKIRSLLAHNNRGSWQLLRASALLGWAPVDELPTLLGGLTTAQQTYFSHIQRFRDAATGLVSPSGSYFSFSTLHHSSEWFLALALGEPHLAQRLFFHARMGLEAAGPGVPAPDSLSALSAWLCAQVAKLDEQGAEGTPPRVRVILTGQAAQESPLDQEDQEVERDEEAPPTADGNTGGDAAAASSATSKSPPGKGAALQCAMVEESMPGGVEWVGGLVTSVNTRKKTLTVCVTSKAFSWSHLSPSSSSSPLFCPLLHERFDLSLY
jgi:hypothetical protein